MFKKILIGLILLDLSGGQIFAENARVTSQYPSPLGVYKNLRVTENAYLSLVTGTGVGIGTTAVGSGSKLDIINSGTYGIRVFQTGSSSGSGSAVGGSVSSAYGIYSEASGATNNWSFYGAAGDGYFSGRVGVGTEGSSSAKLIVQQSEAANILNLYDGSSLVFIVEDGGNVGIGTGNPSYKLHVVDNSNSATVLKVENSGTNATMIYGSGSGSNATAVYGSITGEGGGTAGKFMAMAEDGGRAVWGVAQSEDAYATNYGGDFEGSGGGDNYGVRAIASGGAGKTNYGVYTTVSGGGYNYGVRAEVTGNPSNSYSYALYGSAEGGSTTYGLYIAKGEARISCGTTSAVWTYNSSSGYSSCNDVAEIFDGMGDMEPGDVAVVNFKTGKIQKSSSKYENNLAGVYSTSPGMLLGSKDVNGNGVSLGGNPNISTTDVPLALAGKVPVKISNEGGAVKVGDFLTSASKPGYAMKANKEGRVLGVALEAFEGQEGKVLMMVNLHWWDGGELDKLRSENEAMKLRLDKLEKKLAAK